MKDFFSLKEVFRYYFRGKDEGVEKPDLNLRMMHGINKISLIVFLVGIIFFVVKRVFLS